MNIAETHALTKVYGTTYAVNHFDMHVPQGSIYGFVGRNGAGKSTVMKLLAGLAAPSQGEIQLFGGDQDIQSQRTIGVLIEQAGLYPGKSARENMMMKALCMGVIEPEKACDDLLAFVGLNSVGKKKTKQFSMGMKQRLGLALALLGNPDLLLIDEPLNGLDPEGAREIRRLITQLNSEQGITVVISSHILGQLEKMATHYGIIREGTMVSELTAQEVEAECSHYLLLRTPDPARTVAILQEKSPGLPFQVMPDGSITIQGEIDTTRVAALLQEASIPVQELYVYRRDLEDFFVGLMGADSHV